VLLIQITKRVDGSSVLRCVRSDGSVTWQKQDSKHAAFFAYHDLTHFAVESVLGYQQGFFGLIAQGWEIEDTTGKGSRGRLPDEALEVENLVGLLDRERGGSALWSVEEFNDTAALQASSTGRTAPRPLSPEDLAQVKAKRSGLFSQWRALPIGQCLQLQFEQI